MDIFQAIDESKQPPSKGIYYAVAVMNKDRKKWQFWKPKTLGIEWKETKLTKPKH